MCINVGIFGGRAYKRVRLCELLPRHFIWLILPEMRTLGVLCDGYDFGDPAEVNRKIRPHRKERLPEVCIVWWSTIN